MIRGFKTDIFADGRWYGNSGRKDGDSSVKYYSYAASDRAKAVRVNNIIILALVAVAGIVTLAGYFAA